MPTSIATTIARQLGADATETERVLESLVHDIRHDVARDGQAAIPGLGTFRFFDGTIVFEPDPALALAVNHRYAGLESLLVGGGDTRYEHPAPPLHEEVEIPAAAASGAYANLSKDRSSEPEDSHATPEEDIEQPIEMTDEPAAAVSPSWIGYDVEQVEDSEADIDELDDATPPPELTEIVPTGFDREVYEGGEAAQDTSEPDLPEVREEAGYAYETEEQPDLLAEMPPYVPAVPAFDGVEITAEDEEEEEIPVDTDIEDQLEAGDEVAPSFPEYRQDVDYEEPPGVPPDIVSSPFFEPWPEDVPGFQPEQAARVYSEPKEEPADEPEAPVDERVASEHVAPPEPYEIEAPVAYGTSFYQPDVSTEDTYSETHPISEEEDYGTITPVAAMPPDAGSAPVDETQQPVVEADGSERKRSRTPLLVAAVFAVILAGAVLFLMSRPREEPLPPANIAQNEPAPPPALPSDTSTAAPADTAVIAAGEQEPPPADQSPAQQVENVSPLRRPGGIDLNAGGLTLVVASTPSRTSAEAVAERYRQQGYTTAIFYGAYGGVTRYRVGVGQFSDQRAAEAQLGNLPSGFPGDAWPMPIQSDMEVYQ